MNFSLTITQEFTSGWHVAAIKELPNCTGQGSTLEIAMVHLGNALADRLKEEAEEKEIKNQMSRGGWEEEPSTEYVIKSFNIRDHICYLSGPEALSTLRALREELRNKRKYTEDETAATWEAAEQLFFNTIDDTILCQLD